MFAMILLLATIALVSYAFYKWATANNDYFEKRNVKFIKPSFLFGSTSGLFFNKYDATEFSDKFYSVYPGEP